MKSEELTKEIVNNISNTEVYDLKGKYVQQMLNCMKKHGNYKIVRNKRIRKDLRYVCSTMDLSETSYKEQLKDNLVCEVTCLDNGEKVFIY